MNVHTGLIRGNWKVRFFRLTVGHLAYFDSPTDHAPIKVLPLRGAQVRRRVDLPETYAFELCWLNHASLLLRGASDDDVEDWLLVLRSAIGKDEFVEGNSGPTLDSPNSSERHEQPTLAPAARHLASASNQLRTTSQDRVRVGVTATRRSAFTANVLTTRADFAAIQKQLLVSASGMTGVLSSSPPKPLQFSANSDSSGDSHTDERPPPAPAVRSPGVAASPLSGSAAPALPSSPPPSNRSGGGGAGVPPSSPPPGRAGAQLIRSTSAFKDPQPLSNQSKLEWLKQAKRELVSEADPLLQYDIDYSARLGKGGFGEVYLATHRASGDKVAIKQLEISKKNRMEYLLIETDLHARVSQHRNVVRFVDAFLLREEKQFWVVMEYIDGAPLSEVKQLEAFDEEHACWVVRNVVDALVYIHHTNRIHRDVKSANVLLSVAGEVKLTDFGLAAQLTEEHQFRKTMLGTADFMAPELLRGEAYGVKVDVWAIGMMMHEMLRGATPFAALKDPSQVLSQLELTGVPTLKRKKLSSVARDFVEQCLRSSPDERPDSATLLEHPWFSSFAGLDGSVLVPLVLQIKSGDSSKPARPGDVPTAQGCSVQ